jgi:hypothetical protein
MSENWFDNPRVCDAVCYDLILSDYPRGLNRARIADLANGAPPYTNEEVEANNINVNISDLSHTRLLHDARTQYANGILKTGYFARCRSDYGPVHKRDQRNVIVTREWNKRVKASVQYYERQRANLGLLVLHGISPGVWEREDDWCPVPLGIEDVLLPGETLLGFRNLPFMVFRRSLTGIELDKLTKAEKRDRGWNIPFVKRIMGWLHEQATQLRALNWPDVWSPEKVMERAKESSGGTLAGDRAPKIDVFDIYAYDDSKGQEGWVRRMILDSWSEPVMAGSSVSASRKGGILSDTNGFLFNSGNRKVARNWNQIACFQYADLSAVFPARYHSTRSLGWMLYAACHLGNRLRCKFYESVLENLTMLFEVDSQADAQNALKLNLVNRGFIDKTIRPVKAQDRWQPNGDLIALGLRDNAQVISENAASYVQSRDYSAQQIEKTRFQVMAELQAATSLVSSAMNQSYQYLSYEYREIFRRFCRPNSTDPDVREFRAACARQGVPQYLLDDPTVWEIEPERVMGGGNKSLEMQIADWLMLNRNAFDPEPQRDILRRAALAYTDDPAFSLKLVPEEPTTITASVREAEHIASTLLAGIPVEPLTGENHIEITETLLRILAERVLAGLKQGGMVAPEELQGLRAIADHIRERMKMMAADKDQQERLRGYAQTLGTLLNQLKAFEQRLMEAMKAQAQGNGSGGLDPKDAAKIEATKLDALTKREIAQQSSAQRTAQRQVQHDLKMRQQMEQHQADIAKTDLEAASNIRRNRVEEGGE